MSDRDATRDESAPGHDEPEELVLLQPHTGWYDDPDDPARSRYWDGVTWRGRPRDDVPSLGPFPGARRVPRSEVPQYRPPSVAPPHELTVAERLRASRVAALVAGIVTLLGPLLIWYRRPGGYVTLWSAHPGLAAAVTLAGVVALAAVALVMRWPHVAGAIGCVAAALALLCAILGLRAPAGGILERGALVTTVAALALSIAATTAWRAALER